LKIALSIAGLLLSALLCPNGATAGVSTKDGPGCARSGAAGPLDVMTYAQPSAITRDSLLIRDAYASGGVTVCSTDTALTFKNDPEGPSQGSTVDPGTLGAFESDGLVARFLDLWNASFEVFHSSTVVAGRCTPCAGAKQFGGAQVIELIEGSPAMTVIVSSPLKSRHDNGLVLPFYVLSAGDGDWFEISNRGRVFWKMPMKDLVPGHFYFAVVPDESLTDGSAVWTFYLNSALGRDSTVYIPWPHYNPLP
jgi:hypothetical protein